MIVTALASNFSTVTEMQKRFNDYLKGIFVGKEWSKVRIIVNRE